MPIVDPPSSRGLAAWPAGRRSRLVGTAVPVLPPGAAGAGVVAADLRAGEAHGPDGREEPLRVAELCGEASGLGEQHGLGLADLLHALLDQPQARLAAIRELLELVAPALAGLG